MISSQEGTDDRLPRAAFLPCRPACSPAGSVCADGSATGASAGAAVDPPGALAVGDIAAGECVTSVAEASVEAGDSGTDA